MNPEITSQQQQSGQPCGLSVAPCSAQSKTPRTDYATLRARIVTPEFLGGTSNVVTSQFAQELEIENQHLAAALRKIMHTQKRMGLVPGARLHDECAEIARTALLPNGADEPDAQH